MANFQDGVLISLEVTKWGGARKLEPEDLDLSPEDVPGFMRLGKKMLIPPEERNKFLQIENNARNEIERNGFKFPVGGAYFVPRRMISALHGRLEQFHVEWDDVVGDFLIRYHAIRDEMISRYPKYADKLEPFYPSRVQVRRRFSFQWSAFEISEMTLRETDPQEVIEAYETFKSNLRGQFDSFLSDVVTDLRFRVQETCRNLAERLQKGELVNGNTINAVNLMIDRFTALNFVGDKAIETRSNGLRRELTLAGAGDLKSNQEIRNQLGSLAAEIAMEAADLSDVSAITGNYKRKIEM